MTVLDRAEVVLDVNDRGLIAGTRRGGIAMVALGNIAADAAQKIARSMLDAGKASIRAAIDMEKLQLGLQVTAGGAEQATRQMAGLERIARLPGLGFREVISGANQLNVAFGDMPDTIGRTNRTLAAFGRAVALTGGGPAELQRVITQVTQIASAGKLLQQDLRPIIQTAPAVGQALKNAFGTISPQEIESLGLTTEQFMDTLVGALEDLPEPMETTANALENLQDSAFRAGAALGDMFLPAINAGATFLANELERAADALERTDPATMARAGAAFLSPTAIAPFGALFGVGPSDAGSRAGGATQFLPGRGAAPGAGAADQEAEMRAQTEAIREQGAAFAETAFEAEQFDLRLELLNQRAQMYNERVTGANEPTLAWTESLGKLEISAFDLETATGTLNIKLDEEAVKANVARIAIEGLSDAQRDAADAASKLGSALGILGGLAGGFGLALPFLGNASSFLGAFTSAIPFFAEGGVLEPGELGVVGERGPELITGPAEVTPLDGGLTLNLEGAPPADNPLAMIQNQRWLRFLEGSMVELGGNGSPVVAGR